MAEDGGDITFKEFDVDSGVVMVKMSVSVPECVVLACAFEVGRTDVSCIRFRRLF